MGAMDEINSEIFQASFFDEKGAPVYHEIGGVKWWGPAGLAQNLGQEPQIVTYTDEELADMTAQAQNVME